MLVTRHRKTRVAEYTTYEGIAKALRWGDGWRPDPIKGSFDVVTHPTRIQHRLDTNKRKIEDCLPITTKVLCRNRGMVELQHLSVGDEIWDGLKWTMVLAYFPKGVLPVKSAFLNNGSVLTATDDHRMLLVPKTKKGYSNKENAPVEKRFCELSVGDDLYQPVNDTNFGNISLDPDDAYILGLYISEGWSSDHRVGFSGIENSKGHRERLIEICIRNGYKFYEQERSVTISNKSIKALVDECGKYGPEKHLPHINFDRQTTEILLDALDADSHIGKNGRKKGQITFSTTSEILALQYRLLRRKLGQSVSIFKVDNHGGLGKNPIYRVYVRGANTKKLWAKITNVVDEGLACEVCDITTESGTFYLPENDIIVHNCDGHAAYWCVALLKSGLAARAWFCFYQMQKNDSDVKSGHAVCVFEDHLGNLHWADYGTPRRIEDDWDWTNDSAKIYNATPIAAAMFEVTLRKRTDSLNWGKTTKKVNF